MTHSSMKSQNGSSPASTMVGLAKTVQLSSVNDFLAVFEGLKDASEDDILLVISTFHSSILALLFQV